MNIVKYIAMYVTCVCLCGISVANHIDQSQGDFDQGVYANTEYNAVNNVVNLSANSLSGTYTSRIVDFLAPVQFDMLEWVPAFPVGKQLPDNGISETVYSSGNANMSNNQLLMHLQDDTFTDTSPNGYVGTCSGTSCPIVVPGLLGNALQFDGNDVITLNNQLAITGTVTYGAWFKANSFRDWAGIISNLKGSSSFAQGGYNMQVGTVQKIACGGHTYVNSLTMPVINKRYHAVCVYDGTAMSLYVDGVFQSKKNRPLLVPPSTYNMVIGTFYNNPTDSLKFDGIIDEAFVFDRALSAQEIQDFYRRGATKISVQTRSCDDVACSGESFSSSVEDVVTGNNILPSHVLADANNRYFQYKINLETIDTQYSPQVEKVVVKLKNAPYTIEHYQENLSGNYLISTADTQTLTGAIDTTATVTPKTFTGYTEHATHPDRVLTGTILSGGGLTLKLYYQLNEYTVTFSGTSIGDQTIKHGGLATEPTDPTQTGYTFDGWYKDTNLTMAHDFSTDTITADTTLYPKRINNPPQFDAITLTSNNVKNPNLYAKAGDKIAVTIALTEADTRRSSYNKLTFSIGAIIGLQTANYLGTNSNPSKLSGYRNYTILSGQNGTGFVFTALQFEDRDSNAITGFVSPYIPIANIIVDTTLPEISFSDDVAAGPVSSDTITLTVTDANPDTTTYTYGFSADATCDATDTYTNTYTSGTSWTLSGTIHNGQYICVQAEDMAGNISYQASAHPLNIDPTKPRLTITTTQTLFSGAVTINFTGSDSGSGIEQVQCQLNGTGGARSDCSTFSTGNAITGTRTSSSLSDGTYTLYTRATDYAANVSDIVSHAFTVDATKPIINTVSADIAGGIANPVFSFTGTDATSGLDRREIVIDGGIPIVFSGSETTYATSGLPGDRHVVTFTLIDKAGNISDTKMITFPPVVEIIAPTTMSSGSITDSTVKITGPDTMNIGSLVASGVNTPAITGCTPALPGPLGSAGITCTIGAITTGGTLAITAVSTDGFTGSNSQLYQIDSEAPVVTFTDDVSTAYNTGDTIAIQVTDTQNNQDTTTYTYGFVATQADCASGATLTNTFTSEVSFVIDVEDHNNTYICAKASDTFGNITYQASTNPLKIDITKPIVSITSPAAISGSNLTSYPVQGTCTPGDLDVEISVGGTPMLTGTTTCTASGTFAMTFDVSTLPEGDTTITITQKDLAGNIADTKTATIPKDSTSPTIAPVADQTTDEDSPITPLTITTSESGSNITVTGLPTGLSFDTNTAQITGTPTDPNTNTPATVTITATDTLGNTSQTTFTYTIRDVTTPAITIAGDNPTIIRKNAPYTDLGATCTDNYDTTCTVTTSGSVDTSTIGSYTITYIATDAAGNTATQTRIVQVITGDAPIITLMGSGSLTVERLSPYTDPGATATDPEDGTITSQIVTSGSVDTSTVGTYTINYDVTDSSDNSAPQVTRTITVVDTTAPVAPTITSPADGYQTTDRQPTITGTAEPGSTITLTIDGQTYTTITDIAGNRAISLTANLNYGSQTIAVTATDTHNNTSPPITRTMTIQEIIRGASGRGTVGDMSGQNVAVSGRSTSALDGLLNPDFVTQCVTPIDKPIIDQKNNVTQQFKHAQQLIYSYGLTQYRGTKDYGPERQITREEAARFFTEFTTNILCRKPIYTYNQNFTDLDDADPTLHDYIRKSFEYGIFQGDAGDAAAGLATTFRPKDLLSYDELVAVLVRLVTNQYNESYDANRPVRYRAFLQTHTSVRIQNTSRDNIARVIYDLYKNNRYDLQDVGYVIKR